MKALVAIGKRLYGLWMRFAHLLGTVNRYILMTVFYWVIIDIVNLGLRLLRVDLLDRRYSPRPSYWHDRLRRPPTYRNQF